MASLEELIAREADDSPSRLAEKMDDVEPDSLDAVIDEAKKEDGEVLDVPVPQRREMDPQVPIRPNALHCYGVDFLTTATLSSVFSRFPPKKIEWLDDASCNIVFDSAETTDTVYKKMTRPIPDSTWRRSPDICIDNQEPRYIEIRRCTVGSNDKKNVAHHGKTDSAFYQDELRRQGIDTDEVRDTHAEQAVRSFRSERGFDIELDDVERNKRQKRSEKFGTGQDDTAQMKSDEKMAQRAERFNIAEMTELDKEIEAEKQREREQRIEESRKEQQRRDEDRDRAREAKVQKRSEEIAKREDRAKRFGIDAVIQLQKDLDEEKIDQELGASNHMDREQKRKKIRARRQGGNSWKSGDDWKARERAQNNHGEEPWIKGPSRSPAARDDFVVNEEEAEKRRARAARFQTAEKSMDVEKPAAETPAMEN